MKDVTEKYANMIEAFECDFVDIEEHIMPDELGNNKIRLDFPISKKLFDDIKLIRELSFNLRHGKAKIMEEEEITEKEIEEILNILSKEKLESAYKDKGSKQINIYLKDNQLVVYYARRKSMYYKRNSQKPGAYDEKYTNMQIEEVIKFAKEKQK